MANWAEGTFKIRGRKSDVIGWLTENLVSVSYFGNHLDKEVSLINQDTELYIIPKSERHDNWWINESHRGFIEDGIIQLDIFGEDIDETLIIELSNFKQAWSVVPENFIDQSRKHSVDIKIFAWELGMQTSQEVEIIDGKVTKNEQREYYDYNWEVPFMNLGG